jgi:hypothetical protein
MFYIQAEAGMKKFPSIFIVLAVCLSAHGQTTNGLIAHYRFKGSGRDSSGYTNNNITYAPGYEWADRFNGYAQGTRIDCVVGGPISANVKGLYQHFTNSSFTLAWWFVNVDTNSGDILTVASSPCYPLSKTVIFSKNGNTIQGSGNLFVQITNDWKWHQLTLVATNVPPGPLIGQYNYGLFLDGLQVSGPPGPPQVSFNIYDNTNFAFGMGFEAIDSVRFYNRTLSSNEISDLYAAESVPLVSVYGNESLSISGTSSTNVTFDLFGLTIRQLYSVESSTAVDGRWYCYKPFTATNSTMRVKQLTGSNTKWFFRLVQQQ